MQISNKQIAKICNYKEIDQLTPNTGVISYLEFVSDDEEIKREIVRQKREDNINTILDLDSSEHIYSSTVFSENIPTIRPIVRQINVKSKSYLDISDIWFYSINYLNSITNQVIKIQLKTDKNKTEFENLESSARQIISNFINQTILICKECRLTPKTALIGSDLIKYFDVLNLNRNSDNNYLINGVEIMPSFIDKDKVIIIANNGDTLGVGLNVVNNINNSTYYISETPNTWTNAIKWFTVI